MAKSAFQELDPANADELVTKSQLIHLLPAEIRKRKQTQAALVHHQAMTMAIADVFLLLTFPFLGCIALLPLMRKPRSGTGGGGH